MELTQEERNAIARLKRLAATWPPSLWLFATHQLNVMKTENGERVYTHGGVDVSYRVAIVDIPSDGGDW